MSTSSRRVALECALASLLVAGAALAATPRVVAPGGIWLRPLWLVVAVFAARYGHRGLLISLAICTGMATVGSAASAEPIGPLLAGAGEIAELVPLGVCILLGWIGAGHAGRERALAGNAERARARCEEADAVIGKLREATVSLRARNERIGTSLGFLREVAQRIDQGPAADGAQAAMELAIERSGARAAVIYAWRGRQARPWAWRGVWDSNGAEPPAIAGDRTAILALTVRKAVQVGEFRGASELDSDLAAPIFDRRGAESGVLALRGVPRACVTEATLHDLAEIARWCSGLLPGATESQPASRGGEASP